MISLHPQVKARIVYVLPIAPDKCVGPISVFLAPFPLSVIHIPIRIQVQSFTVSLSQLGLSSVPHDFVIIRAFIAFAFSK